MPNDEKKKILWLNNISRKNFNSIKYHRVCSDYFQGGEKMYTNNISTIVPKKLKTQNSLGIIPKSNDVQSWTVSSASNEASEETMIKNN